MSHKITVVGLGYVGMSMSVLLSKDHDVIAFDIDKKKVGPISGGSWDDNTEVSEDRLLAKWENEEKKMKFSLGISRLDGSSSFRIETDKAYVIQPGTCEKIDLNKKLF